MMFLSLPELKSLTGTARKKPMIKWLQDNHYLYEIRADGWPVVMHSHVVARLSSIENEVKRPELVLSK